jgi:hypothetical protein
MSLRGQLKRQRRAVGVLSFERKIAYARYWPRE